MKVNRGCGCLLLVLAALNALFVVAAIYNLASGNISVVMGILTLVLFGANLVAALMLGLAGFRGRAVGAPGAPAETDSIGPEEEQGGAIDEGIE